MEIKQSMILVEKCMKLQWQEYWLKKVWQTTTVTWITITQVCTPPQDLPPLQEGSSFKVNCFLILDICVFSQHLLLVGETIRNHKSSQTTKIIIAIRHSAHHVHYSLYQSQFHQLIHHLKWLASKKTAFLKLKILHSQILIIFDYFCSIFQITWLFWDNQENLLEPTPDVCMEWWLKWKFN